MKYVSNLKSEESGLISIAVTLIVMSILTLMAIGFSNLASREYRQAVDQQLSTQAFYAAESGVNKAIEDGTATCDSSVITPVGTDNSAAITCVLVNLEPSTLEYSDVGQDSSIIVPIKANSPITRVRISWQAKDGSVDFPNNCEARLQSLSDWGSKTPVLNAMLIPAKDFSTRDELANKTQKLILYPTSAACGGAGNYPAVNGNVDTKGSHVNASCNSSNTPKYCFVDINNTNGLVSGNADFILRLKSIYGSSAVSITAFNGADQVPFVGAQKEIDSTGRAGDVLRRVKVNVPIASQSAIFPEFAVEVTKGLCKRMTVGTTVLANPSTGVCAIPLTTDQATGGGTGGLTLP
jgi:Tfp pilus assembly protein PilX